MIQVYNEVCYTTLQYRFVTDEVSTCTTTGVDRQLVYQELYQHKACGQCSTASLTDLSASVPAVKDRQGPKVDVTMSRVPDPASIPVDKDRGLPQTMWRIDRLREMTYTQFWHLIQERQIERVCSHVVVVAAAHNPSGNMAASCSLSMCSWSMKHSLQECSSLSKHAFAALKTATHTYGVG